jgi:hypothetical protein
LPPKGIRRVRQAVFGVVTLDSRLFRDDPCMADHAAEREHELALAKAQAEALRAEAERDREAVKRLQAEESCAQCRAK